MTGITTALLTAGTCDKLPVMETPIPVNTSAASGWKPSSATVIGGAVGTAVAQIVTFVLGQFGIVLDPATQGAVVSLLTILGVYVMPANGGRQ